MPFCQGWRKIQPSLSKIIFVLIIKAMSPPYGRYYDFSGSCMGKEADQIYRVIVNTIFEFGITTNQAICLSLQTCGWFRLRTMACWTIT